MGLRRDSSSATIAVEAPKLLRHLKTDQLEALKFHFENADAARKLSVSGQGTVVFQIQVHAIWFIRNTVK